MISLQSAITIGLVIVVPPNVDRLLAPWFSLRLPRTRKCERDPTCDYVTRI